MYDFIKNKFDIIQKILYIFDYVIALKRLLKLFNLLKNSFSLFKLLLEISFHVITDDFKFDRQQYLIFSKNIVKSMKFD